VITECDHKAITVNMITMITIRKNNIMGVCDQCPIESSGGHMASAMSVVMHHLKLNLH